MALVGASLTGVMTGLDVAASNISFKYITVSFYVMVKSSSLIFMLFFGVIASVEPCSLRTVLTVLMIAFGVFLSSYGEAHFSKTGFGLVIASELFAAIRWVGTQVLLGSGQLDTVATVLYMAPGSTLSLAPLAAVKERASVTQLSWNYFAMILIPGFLSFLLLIIEVQLVKETSSLSLAVIGNLKSVVTIIFAVALFREHASRLQWCGLFLSFLGISSYAYSKRNAQKEDGYETVAPPAAQTSKIHPDDVDANNLGRVEYDCPEQVT